MVWYKNMQPKTNRGYFAKFLKFKTDTYTFGRDYFIYVFKKETSAAIWGGGGCKLTRRTPSPLPKGLLMASTWELNSSRIGGRQVLDHNCSLLLSNCKIIRTSIVTLELHATNWYSTMKLNNFIIPLYCCDSKSNFCAGFFFALKWNKLQWAGYLVESMTSVSGVNMHHWSVNLCGKCNGCAFINECNKTNSILKKPSAQPCFMWTVCNVKGTQTVVLSSTSYET